MNENAPLTQTERKVADHYADGASFKEIATQLGRSPHTVRSHLKNIYRKLGVSSKIALRKELGATGYGGSRPPVINLSEAREDRALYQSARKLARNCTKADQDVAAGIFRELQDRHPNFSGSYAGLSFMAGGAAIATADAPAASALLEEATTLADKSLRLNRFDVDAHLSMGRALAFDGDFAASDDHIRFALECDDSSEWSQYMRVFLMTHTGKPGEAIRLGEAFRKTMRDTHALEPMSFELGCAYLFAKDWEKAAAWAWSILERNRAHALLIIGACSILLELKQFSKVAAFAKKNRVSLCDPTPLQRNIQSNSMVVDLMTRHRGHIEDLFADSAS
ncbi:LuxR C-terminal-related transcriptional regulator [Cognatiyoonia sp. IB215182]|uniref:LuxR C-terminal-related transcriptional regulator n=1 Tax=Cognatiyoonia sp. IB215182 TaxID=3097353 RepID=UPI002A0AA3E2|nr:LuxR C-terminal-related transcriptional regulator [Cognatiyoonia sp. IB215182]MDX8350778.1 LuxR C-terminal-related transcriptional regulator [Cognatiyoonia sp. IB215182]